MSRDFLGLDFLTSSASYFFIFIRINSFILGDHFNDKSVAQVQYLIGYSVVIFSDVTYALCPGEVYEVGRGTVNICARDDQVTEYS